jgi:hypothetical protein
MVLDAAITAIVDIIHSVAGLGIIGTLLLLKSKAPPDPK